MSQKNYNRRGLSGTYAMKPTRSPAPLIAALLLLLPLLYVGSYLALVTPPQSSMTAWRRASWSVPNYRIGGRAGDVLETVFYPLQRIDRRLRPAAWGQQIERIELEYGEFERIGVDFGP